MRNKKTSKVIKRHSPPQCVSPPSLLPDPNLGASSVAAEGLLSIRQLPRKLYFESYVLLEARANPPPAPERVHTRSAPPEKGKSLPRKKRKKGFGREEEERRRKRRREGRRRRRRRRRRHCAASEKKRCFLLHANSKPDAGQSIIASEGRNSPTINVEQFHTYK